MSPRSIILYFCIPVLALMFCRCLFAQSAAAVPPALPSTQTPAIAKESWDSPVLARNVFINPRPLRTPAVLRGNHTFEEVRVEWRAGDPINIYISKPALVEKPPVVIYLYGHDVDPEIFRTDEFQEGSTRGGVASVGFPVALTPPRLRNRGLKHWFVSDLQEALATTAHDVQLLLDYLESRNEFDMQHVGILAQDGGGSVAILAAAVDSRIKVLDLVDPWGDWPDWLQKSLVIPPLERAEYTTPQFMSSVSGLDPVDWVGKVHAKIRLQDAVFGTKTTPLVCKEKIRAALPKDAKIVIYKTPEEAMTATAGEKALQWIKAELNPTGAQTSTQVQVTEKQSPTVAQ